MPTLFTNNRFRQVKFRALLTLRRVTAEADHLAAWLGGYDVGL